MVWQIKNVSLSLVSKTHRLIDTTVDPRNRPVSNQAKLQTNFQTIFFKIR